MAKILLIEDLPHKAIQRASALEAAGHEVVGVVEERLPEFVSRVRDHLAAAPYDILLLDLNLNGDQWGGVSLYNWLKGSSLRNRWDYTIITTMYTAGVLPPTYNQDNPDAFILRVFAQTACIPFDNVLPSTNGSGGRTALQLLVDRIAELVAQPRPQRCDACGEPLY